MSAAQLSDPHQAPQDLLELYFKQLFYHLSDDQIQAIRRKIKLYPWVIGTCDSYLTWLSYATIEIYTHTEKIRFKNHRFTRSTHVHRELLETATQDDLKAYHDWAFVESVVGKPSPTGYSTSLVSPVHFWFFVSCRQSAPPRPVSPSLTNELFYHPLFLMPSYTGPAAPFVVPEYFFRDDVAFDASGDLKTCAYYLFPSFGKLLFDYVADPMTQLGVGSFITYYAARQDPWFIPAGTNVDGLIDRPHQILKVNWRWEEVLAMLHEPQQDLVVVGRSRKSRSPPRGYAQHRHILAYFDSFARMAKIWIREN